jgi:hypothetical protein
VANASSEDAKLQPIREIGTNKFLDIIDSKKLYLNEQPLVGGTNTGNGSGGISEGVCTRIIDKSPSGDILMILLRGSPLSSL